MVYSPLGIVLLGDFVNDPNFLGRILFLITHEGVVSMLWTYGEILEDSNLLGKKTLMVVFVS